MASLNFFSCKKACHTKSFCLRMLKNKQRQHKGKPHTHEKIQGTAISWAVAVIIFRGVNLSVAHCTVYYKVIPGLISDQKLIHT